MLTKDIPFVARRRLVLRSGPVAQLHDFALIYWFRSWLADEDYRGCQAVVEELRRREQVGHLRVALLVDGFRDKHTGEPDFSGLNGLLDGWRITYPHLFTPRAARRWLRSRQLMLARGGLN